MAYESDDICPPCADVKTFDASALSSTDRETPRPYETQAMETEIPHIRPDDGDLYPKQLTPQYRDISRPPDFKAGDNIDYEDANAKSEEDSADSSASPLLVAITWVVGGGLALWLYFQLAGLLRVVLECQGWRLWVALMLFAIPVLALAYAAIRFFLVFRKLSAREQVRGDLQSSDITQNKILADRLRPYLADLPKNYDTVFERVERKDIKVLIEKLRDDSSYSDSNGWIDDFDKFQKAQEDRALDIVKTYCKLVALKTAACPWKAVDMVIVFVNSTLMIEKIAKVYNRRVSKPAALKLLCRWFMNIYISGELGAITENAAHRASDKVAEWLTNGDSPNVGVPIAEAAADQVADDVANSVSDGGAAESLAGMFTASLPVLSKFVGKAAEGAINAYFAYRMGRRAIDEFRFVVPSAVP